MEEHLTRQEAEGLTLQRLEHARTYLTTATPTAGWTI
jgi:hypothetical protein